MDVPVNWHRLSPGTKAQGADGCTVCRSRRDPIFLLPYLPDLAFSKAKERGPDPVDADDDPGEGGQTEIGLLPPDKPIWHDGDGAAGAAEFPDQQCTGLEPLAALVTGPFLAIGHQ